MVRFRFLFLLLAGLAAPIAASADALNWANGYWGVNPKNIDSDDYEQRNCDDDPVEIRIDSSTNAYWSKSSDAGARTAAISEIAPRSFTINYDNEDRVMDDGRLHIWTMVFLDEDSFYWIREDWKAQSGLHRTVMRYRCLLEVS